MLQLRKSFRASDVSIRRQIVEAYKLGTIVPIEWLISIHLYDKKDPSLIFPRVA